MKVAVTETVKEMTISLSGKEVQLMAELLARCAWNRGALYVEHEDLAKSLYHLYGKA